MASAVNPSLVAHKRSLWQRMVRKRYVYLLLIPVAAYFIIFHYLPMWGIIIAFQKFQVFKGVFHSPWVGLANFESFFNSRSFWPIIRNSLVLNLYSIAFVFPIPILFALILNEINHDGYKRVIQTITYLPHFISVVVLVSMISGLFSSTNGLVNQLIRQLGGDSINFLTRTEWFRPLYLGSGIWQETGWSSIIYIAAIAGIDTSLYDAARIDGANRPQQILHVTLPGIAGTIIIMLIMRTGSILSVGLEKVLLMGNSANSDVSRVLSSYVYQRGLIESDFGFATAVSLFNSVVSLITLGIVNLICKKTTEVSIW